MFEITRRPTFEKVPLEAVNRLQAALKLAKCPVAPAGRLCRSVYPRETSKVPLYKVRFAETGEIVEVLKNNFEARRWERAGNDPLGYYKEFAQLIYELADKASAKARCLGPEPPPKIGPEPPPSTMTADASAYGFEDDGPPPPGIEEGDYPLPQFNPLTDDVPF